MAKLERLLACSLLLGGLWFVSSAAGETSHVNSCVNCHSGLPADSLIKVKSHGWSGSVHQQHGVTCDRCHGGAPTAAAKDEAHAGLLGSSNQRSPVYFKNIPATCGKCHGAEFYKFSQSRHYRMLEETGQGPECVTCHGSMETKILAPETLAGVCERCHNQRIGIFPYVPQKARAVLLLLRESNILLAAEKKLHGDAPSPETTRVLATASAALHAAKLDWHRFDLDTITDHLQDFSMALEKMPSAP